LAILAHPFIINVPVESSAKAAMLTASRGCRHDLDEGVVGRDPNAQEGVDVDGGAPLEELEDLLAILAVGFFFAFRQRHGSTIDLDISGGRNLNAVATEVSPDGQLVANLLGEDSIDGVGSAVGGGQGPAAAGVVGVGHVVHGTDRSNGSSARSNDLHIHELLDGAGELEIPEPLGPVQFQGVVLVLTLSLASLNLGIHQPVFIMNGHFSVQESSQLIAIGLRLIFFRVSIPVGSQTSLDQTPGLGDDVPHPVGQLDKVNIPSVLPGIGGIPHGHVAGFGGGQLVASSGAPFRRVLLFHTLLVIPFVSQRIITILSGLMLEVNLDLTLTTSTRGTFTVLEGGSAFNLHGLTHSQGQEFSGEVRVLGLISHTDNIRSDTQFRNGASVNLNLDLVVNIARSRLEGKLDPVGSGLGLTIGLDISLELGLASSEEHPSSILSTFIPDSDFDISDGVLLALGPSGIDTTFLHTRIQDQVGQDLSETTRNDGAKGLGVLVVRHESHEGTSTSIGLRDIHFTVKVFHMVVVSQLLVLHVPNNALSGGTRSLGDNSTP